MNFLGHLFLSGDDPLVVVGNFMADAVKGGHFDDRPASVVKGIRLHRAIDGFTDNHPAQRSGRQRVRAHAGRYSGVVMDLFFDHLLAERWSEWHSEPLPRFARSMYDLLDRHQVHMDLRTRHMLGHMIKGDWLTGYARIDGIARSLAGLAGRVPEGQVMVGAEVVLVEHLEAYREEFAQFMSDIITHTAPFR
jgi:acyl carrier protein phosphodiesterase